MTEGNFERIWILRFALNDGEFRITDCMDYADSTDLREGFSTTLEMTELGSE